MRHTIFDIPVDDLALPELIERIHTWLQSDEAHFIVTTNPEFLLLAKKDPAFAQLLQTADLSVADGVGLRFAISALTEEHLLHRHPGVDLVYLLCSLAQEREARVVLIGGLPGMADQSVRELTHVFKNLDIHAIDPGMISGNASGVQISAEVLERIQALHPTIVVAALGQGKQERFLRELMPHVPTMRIGVGVGGTFETIAGHKPRAPLWLRRIGLEWVWRVLIEPKRFYRIFQATCVFPSVVIFATLRQHRFINALKRTLPEVWKQLRNKS